MDIELSRMLTDAEAKKIYSFLRREERLIDVAKKLEIKLEEAYGLVELLNYFDLPISIVETEGEMLIRKGRKSTNLTHKKVKEHIEDCKKITIGVVSDSHLCSKVQQLHMLNTAYRYFYENGINIVYNCGDIVDGDYSNKRPAHIYSRFCNGVDEQSDYVIDMYPKIDGIETFFIQGSHDETHKLNGGATLGRIIDNGRNDLHYLGQDHADVVLDKTTIRLRHPGGGVSKYRSRSIQHTIDSMQTGNKPNALLEGHYHKSLYLFYRNVHGVLVPSLCYQSQYMERKDISNIMGFYDIDMYVDDKGDIQYFTPREHLFNESQVKKDDWKKTKRLVIK